MRLPSTSRPKIVPAQCVPCPLRSPSPLPLKSRATSSTPANAGCAASMPVSSTATVTPSPVNGLRSAPTAPMPQVPSVAAASTASGSISRTGMVSATPMTCGSRRVSATSAGRMASVSARISGRSGAPGPLRDLRPTSRKTV